MTATRVQCEAATLLTADELAKVADVPDPAYAVEKLVECELEVGHAGRHVGIAMTGSDHGEPVRVWLEWANDDDRSMTGRDLCSASGSIGGDPRYCELPEGHVGHHTFQLRLRVAGRPVYPVPSASSADWVATLDPIASQFAVRTWPLAEDGSAPPIQQILPIVGRITRLAVSALATGGAPNEIGVSDLRLLATYGRYLTSAAEAAWRSDVPT